MSLAVANTQPIKVAVIDTGLDIYDPRFSSVLCKTGHKDFTNTTLNDTLGHGTHIAGLIKQYAKKSNYCLVILKYFNEGDNGFQNLINLNMALREAVAQGVTIVNYSGGGPEFNEREYLTLHESTKVTFIVAAGNNGSNIDLEKNFYYPASYNLSNIISVGALNKDGSKLEASNFGKSVDAWELGKAVSTVPCVPRRVCMAEMMGTSQATAIHTGKYIHELSK